jgi:hypothetical protein
MLTFICPFNFLLKFYSCPFYGILKLRAPGFLNPTLLTLLLFVSVFKYGVGSRRHEDGTDQESVCI